MDIFGTLAQRIDSVAYPKGTRQLRDYEMCECVYSCADDPETACSLSGEFHVHPEWPCEVHPDAPGDR